MEYHGKTFHWDSPMPATPIGQRHESPSTGDNVGAIRRAAGHALDLNISHVAGHNWALHWVTPGPNGYTRVVDARTRKVRKMTLKERRTHGNVWGVEGIRRWRRPNGEAPLTEREAIRLCVKFGTLAIRELKSPSMATNETPAIQSMNTSKLLDHPAWFKTLFNMKGPRGKVAIYQARGGQVALIFGKFLIGRARRLAASKRIQSSWGTVRAHATW